MSLYLSVPVCICQYLALFVCLRLCVSVRLCRVVSDTDSHTQSLTDSLILIHICLYLTLPKYSTLLCLHPVYQVGPVAIVVDASEWHSYAGGIFNGCNQENPDLNHGVVLVGYGEETTGEQEEEEEEGDGDAKRESERERECVCVLYYAGILLHYSLSALLCTEHICAVLLRCRVSAVQARSTGWCATPGAPRTERRATFAWPDLTR